MTRSLRLAAAMVTAVVAAGCHTAAQPVAATSTAELVRQWQQRSGAPAVVVAIDTPRAPLEIHTAGSPTPGGEPLAEDAAFRVASITKMLVATVIIQLVDEGRVELDGPVSVHLPDEPLVAGVTVRQLLDHTSGIPDYGLAPDLGRRLLGDRARTWDTGEVLDLVRGAGREFPPGDAHAYSNTNYVLLGRVIEHVTGRSWADEVRRRVIAPLGLEDTHVPSHGTPPAAVIPAYFDTDDDGDVENVETSPWPSLETTEGAAGAVVSTAADVTRITRAVLAGPLLSPDLVSAMSTPGPHGRRFDRYGLGVEVGRPDRRTLVVGHGGFLPGFRSVTWYVPEHDAVITVLANDSRVDPNDLAHLVLRRLSLGAAIARQR